MSEPLTAAQRVAIARHPQRPNITDYIQALFTDFFDQKVDRREMRSRISCLTQHLMRRPPVAGA